MTDRMQETGAEYVAASPQSNRPIAQSPNRQIYYSFLLPGFRRQFETGVPVLMYHKIARRPAGAVWRALYVHPRFFSRQLRELRAAGFQSAPMDEACAGPDNAGKRFVITFDDGFQNVLENALAPLAENKFRAIQFLVAGLLGKRNEWDLPRGEVEEKLMDALQVREWLAAGHRIGAHTMTHPHLHRIPIEKAREEIFAGKKKLEDTFGLPVEHFAYPYGESNEAVRDLVREAGFRTACITDPGVNTAATPRFELLRYTAREPSLRPNEVLARFMDRVFNVSSVPMAKTSIDFAESNSKEGRKI